MEAAAHHLGVLLTFVITPRISPMPKNERFEFKTPERGASRRGRLAEASPRVQKGRGEHFSAVLALNGRSGIRAAAAASERSETKSPRPLADVGLSGREMLQGALYRITTERVAPSHLHYFNAGSASFDQRKTTPPRSRSQLLRPRRRASRRPV